MNDSKAVNRDVSGGLDAEAQAGSPPVIFQNLFCQPVDWQNAIKAREEEWSVKPSALLVYYLLVMVVAYSFS